MRSRKGLWLNLSGRFSLYNQAAFPFIITQAIFLFFKYLPKWPITQGAVYEEMWLSDGYERGNQEHMTGGLRIHPNVGS